MNNSRSTAPHHRHKSSFGPTLNKMAPNANPNGSESSPVLPTSGATPQPMTLSLHDISSPIEPESDLGGAPPSPSTLTDIILSLHGSLYGAKRQICEIQEMVRRYYDSNAVFDSPLVSAHGRDRIIDQFVLAFALPLLHVRSELRDVICSDFEFDGTRAGIIHHTITVTLFPNLFGLPTTPANRDLFTPGTATSFGGNTPLPYFNNHPVSAGETSGHSTRRRSSFQNSASPRGSSTPQDLNRPPSMSSLRARTLTGNMSSTHLPRPLSLGPCALEETPSESARTQDVSDSIMPSSPVPSMPVDAAKKHWNAPPGLGRRSLCALIKDVVFPSHTLRAMFSMELSLFSRLEFNEMGRIVRHEDTWSVRELVVGILPFFSLCTYCKLTPVYNIQRFIFGLFVSWWVRFRQETLAS